MDPRGASWETIYAAWDCPCLQKAWQCATSVLKVPGEIKRSKDLRGGRWSWDLQVSPEEIMSREVELG